MVKKMMTILLVLLMLLPLMTAKLAVPASAAETDLQATIEQQIRAYADSIDKPGADDDAARIIAMHGILRGGRTMYADEDHALTATLMNSELLQNTLATTFAGTIQIMQEQGYSELFVNGDVTWNQDQCIHNTKVYYDDTYSLESRICKILNHAHYKGPVNGYDSTLTWLAGITDFRSVVTRTAVTDEMVTYKVTLCVNDRFDFDPSTSGSVPSAIASILASALFREFDWESNVTFQLTVPNDCPHEQFTEETVDPTCTTPGGIRHTCAACGYSYIEETSAPKGHTWGAYKSNNDATCQRDGTKTAVCKTCGETDTVTDPGSQKPHNWTPATCLYPETCLDCGETRGDLGTHTWTDATCQHPKTCTVCGETEGEPIAHTWVDATCTDPKKCTMCGLTEGEPLGHEWTGVTCQHANTCKVCGLVVGEPKDHTWVAATCTKAKHCAFCGEESGKPIGHSWSGGSCTVGPTCKNCGTKGKAPGHTWTGGSCTEAQTCSKCGVEGAVLDHQWTAADCHSARVCTVCGLADGQPLGHDWLTATCTEAQSCARCGLTEGEPLGHDWLEATCQKPQTCARCALAQGEPIDHPWISATCYEPKTCPTCGLTEGSPLDHTWAAATCHDPKTCTLCGLAEGDTLDHIWTDGDCTHAPTCQLCAEERTAPGHAWISADCETPRTCAICAETEGKALDHPDGDANGLCDRCSAKLAEVSIQPERVFDWWPIAAIAALVILGIIDFFVVREYRRTKAGYYE